MKGFYLLIIASVFFFETQAQSTHYYTWLGNPADMILSTDSNLLILTAEGRVAKINALGEVIWESSLPSGGPYSAARRIFEMADGTLSVFCNSHLYKLTVGGAILSTFDISDINLTGVEMNNGGFFGYDYLYYTGLFSDKKISETGTLLWENSHTIAPESVYYYTSNNAYHFDGTYSYFLRQIYLEDLEDNPQAFLFNKFDTLGSMIINDTTLLDELKAFSGYEAVGDGFLCHGVAFGKFYLYKTDLNGNMEWETFTQTNAGFQAFDTLGPVKQLWNGNYLRAIRHYKYFSGTYTENYAFESYSPYGDSLYRTNTFFNDSYQIKSIVQMDSNVIAVAGYYLGPDFGTSAMFLLITDTLGNVPNTAMYGKVYQDVNDNDIYDPGDITFPNILLHTVPGTEACYTDGFGNYTMHNYSTGDFTIIPVVTPVWNIITPESYDIVISGEPLLDTIFDLDFQLDYSTAITDPAIALYISGVGIGKYTESYITLNNIGNQIVETGTIELQFPPYLSIHSTDPIFDDFSDSTITWNINSSLPFNPQLFKAVFFTDADTSLIGEPYSLTAKINEIPDDINYLNNADTSSGIIEYSYDPNHKIAIPQGYGANGSTDPSTTTMEYIIEFQNTGTAPAVDIIVRDIIDPDLDIDGIVMLGSSHSYSMERVQPNVVQWVFKNIYLPDSASDLLNSTGFIQMSIPLKEGAGIGTQITNNALIFFDLNAPIVTNTTKNTLEEFVPIIQPASDPIGFTLYPNPAGNYIFIKTDQPDQHQYQIAITDLNGKICFTQESISENNRLQVPVLQLPQGTYTICLRSHSENFGCATFIKQ